MVLRRSSRKKKIYEIKLKYRNPVNNSESTSDKKSNRYGTILIVSLLILVCLL